MNNNFSNHSTDVVELFELLASIPIEYPPEMLAVRQTELIKQVENLIVVREGQGESSLLIPSNAHMTVAMKAVLGLIIATNVILAIYILMFVSQNFNEIIEILKRLFS